MCDSSVNLLVMREVALPGGPPCFSAALRWARLRVTTTALASGMERRLPRGAGSDPRLPRARQTQDFKDPVLDQLIAEAPRVNPSVRTAGIRTDPRELGPAVSAPLGVQDAAVVAPGKQSKSKWLHVVDVIVIVTFVLGLHKNRGPERQAESGRLDKLTDARQLRGLCLAYALNPKPAAARDASRPVRCSAVRSTYLRAYVYRFSCM
jgi:hypothetical protein